MKQAISFKSIKRYHILLFFIILTQCIYLSFSFGINKKGFHSDELWNYGFANSSQGTDIFKENNQLKNFDNWENSSILYDYISVDKSEIFDYSSVYKNCADDYHPFLGFMLLHFICALFPGTWSAWYCFALNLIFFVIQQIFLFKLIRRITNNSYYGIAGVLFFGFTTGAEDILFFLRIYCPATAISVVFMYYLSELYNQRNSSKVPINILVKIAITTLIGCLTLHEFIILAFIAALIYGLFYLITKHFKLAISFGISMISSALLSIAIFPATIPHLFDSSGTFGSQVVKYSFVFQFKLYMSYITNDLFGVATSPWPSMFLWYLFYGLIVFLFFFIPFCFIFRHEKWLKNFFLLIKRKCIDFIHKFKFFNFALFALMIVCISMLAVNAYMTSIVHMGRVSNRYIMIIYPLFAAFVVSLFCYCLNWIFKNKKLKYIMCYGFAVIFATLSILMAPHIFRFNYPHEGVAIEDIEENSNCIIMLSSPFLLTCTTYTLGKTDHFFATTYDTALTFDYKNADINFNDEPLYLLIDTSLFNNNGLSVGGISLPSSNITYDIEAIYDKDTYLSFFKNLDIASNFEKVGTDYNLFGREIEIYRLN